jgi:hypothetical protein
MTIRSWTDEEVLSQAKPKPQDKPGRPSVPAHVAHAYALEIIRLREALREVKARAQAAEIASKTGQDCLEISAKALDGDIA